MNQYQVWVYFARELTLRVVNADSSFQARQELAAKLSRKMFGLDFSDCVARRLR